MSSIPKPAALALACALAACNDTVSTGIDDLDLPAEDAGFADELDGGAVAPGEDAGGERDAEGDASASDAAPEPPKPADLSGLPSFAVHVSEYGQATGITLIDGEGALIKELFVSSQSELPGLSAALASDVALPTQPCDPTYLTLLGRYGSNTVWQLDYRNSEGSRQFSTQLSDGAAAGAYQSNPQDLLCLGGDRALVSRFEPNLLPAAATLDRGDDLVLVDLAKGELMERISLEGLRVDVEGATAYARPSSIVGRGRHAVVGLGLLTESFVGAQPGAVALLSLDDFTSSAVRFEKLANCATVVPVVDRDDAVIVSCSGAPYGAPASSGLALVTIDPSGQATVEAEFQATVSITGSAKPAPIYGAPTSIGGGRVLAVATGQGYEGSDTAFVVDLADGSYELAFEGDRPGGIGAGAVRPETGLVLVPDASTGVRVFKVDADGALHEEDPIALRTDLPPRAIRPMRRF